MGCAQAVSFAVGESKLQHKPFGRGTTIARGKTSRPVLIVGAGGLFDPSQKSAMG